MSPLGAGFRRMAGEFDAWQEAVALVLREGQTGGRVRREVRGRWKSLLKVLRFRQRPRFEIVPRRFRRTGSQESVRKFFRRRSVSPGPKRASTEVWVLVHTGTARASKFLPRGLRCSRRVRWSASCVVILIRPRRRSGFRAAVKVVLSIASNEATAPISGGSGRFKDIINENCPLVRPSGRSALSKRRASIRAARCT
jgi:hypothetical protein